MKTQQSSVLIYKGNYSKKTEIAIGCKLNGPVAMLFEGDCF